MPVVQRRGWDAQVHSNAPQPQIRVSGILAATLEEHNGPVDRVLLVARAEGHMMTHPFSPLLSGVSGAAGVKEKEEKQRTSVNYSKLFYNI